MLHKDPQREDSPTSERLNWFQVAIPFVRVPVYQICANLPPLLKRNLELISCLTLSEESYIFITCIYLTYSAPLSAALFCSLQGAPGSHECVVFNKINIMSVEARFPPSNLIGQMHFSSRKWNLASASQISRQRWVVPPGPPESVNDF